MCTRRIVIVPCVWKELQPWLKMPFCNQAIRDSVIAAIKRQINREVTDPQSGLPNIQVPEDTKNHSFTDHGYEYYLRLLAIRKIIGPLAAAVLTKELGRTPTQDELNAEVQSRFGERGSLIARKGLAASDRRTN